MKMNQKYLIVILLSSLLFLGFTIKQENKIYTLNNTFLKDGLFLDKNTNKPINGTFRRYFKSGIVSFENKYIDGTMEGIQIKYYPSGKEEYIFNYHNNIMIGQQKHYDINGKLTILPAF